MTVIEIASSNVASRTSVDPAGSHSERSGGDVRPSLGRTSGPIERSSSSVPLTIPADEVIFWTRTWREGEAETRAALARGEGRVYPSAADAIRAMLDPTDDID